VTVPAWDALYYDTSQGTGIGAAAFHIIRYNAGTTNFHPPPTWVLICVNNGVASAVKVTAGYYVTSSFTKAMNAALGGIGVGGGLDLTGTPSTLERSALTGAIQASAGSNTTTETIDLVFVIGNGVSLIPTGIKPYWSAAFDFACTIVAWNIVADQSGSISIDVLKCTQAQFDAGATHPVIGDKISATAPITFSTATKAQSSTLTGWTTSVNANDILAFNVASVTSCQQVVINMKVTKTS
jgi:hypothetical protein